MFPTIEVPKDKGVTSKSNKSFISPFKTAP